MKRIIFHIVLLLQALGLFAQDTTTVRQEGWPEADVFYRINDQFRVYFMVSATRLRTSNFSDGGLGLYLEYFAFSALRKKFHTAPIDSTRGYYLYLRAGYYYNTTPHGAKNPVSENTVITEANARFHLPHDLLLTSRNRFDWRILNGVFQPRYRPRLVLARDLRTEYLYFTPYIYMEYFINFKQPDANRFRACAGVELKVTTWLNFETYYLYQFQNDDTVDPVNAIGITLKFYLRHHK